MSTTTSNVNLPYLSLMWDSRRHLWHTEQFKRPFSVELMGAGFDKPANARHFALRFPRMLKIHGDRSLKDTINFGELQEMAKRCSEVQKHVDLGS